MTLKTMREKLAETAQRRIALSSLQHKLYLKTREVFMDEQYMLDLSPGDVAEVMQLHADCLRLAMEPEDADA